MTVRVENAVDVAVTAEAETTPSEGISLIKGVEGCWVLTLSRHETHSDSQQQDCPVLLGLPAGP